MTPESILLFTFIVHKAAFLEIEISFLTIYKLYYGIIVSYFITFTVSDYQRSFFSKIYAIVD